MVHLHGRMDAGRSYQELQRWQLKGACLIEGRSGRINFASLREPRFEGQIRANERFDLAPDSRITLDLDVRFHKNAVPPGILAAAERLRFVLRAEIAKDAGARGISSANLRLAVEHAIELIKIDGLRNIGGDDGVIFASLGHTIHLDRKNHGDAVFLEQACKFDGFRSTPTVPKNNDVR